MQVLAEQQTVVRPGQVSDELGLAVEAERAEAAGEGVVGRGDDAPVDRAEVLEQVGLLLEHGDAEPAGEGLLARVDAQVSLEVPGHAELLAAVGAAVLPDRGRLGRAVVRGRDDRARGCRCRGSGRG